jgi:flagellar hook assembly protein FlgD
MVAYKEYSNEEITVWPNPYYGANVEETGPYDQRVYFSNLPAEGQTTVRIYAVDGTLVRMLKHNDTGSQHLTWDLNNEFGLPVASGMYFAHVDAKNTEKVMKLAIVQPEMRIDTY